MLEEEVDFDSKVGRKSIDLDNKPYHCNFYYCPNENCHQMPNINLVFKDGLKIKINCDYCKEEKELTFDEFFAEVEKEKNNKMLCKNEQKEGARKTENYCTHCQAFLCEDCDEKHRKETEPENHFTMLTDGFKLSSKCSEKGCGDMISSYCLECKTHVCAKHKDKIHENHEIVFIEDIMPDNKYKLISKELFNAPDILDHYTKKAEVMVKQIDEFMETIKSKQKELKDYAKAFKDNKENISKFYNKLNEAYLLTNKVQNYYVINNILQNRISTKFAGELKERIGKIEKFILKLKEAAREPYLTAVYEVRKANQYEKGEGPYRFDIFTTDGEHPFRGLNKNNCEMWIDGKPAEFTKTFDKPGTHKVTVSMKPGEYFTTASSMFTQCISLVSLDFGDFPIDNVKAMNHLCADCRYLRSVEMPKQKNEVIKTMRSMFNNCFKLNKIEISEGIKTKNVTDMSNLFWGCEQIRKLHLPSWSSESLESANEMFRMCTSLSDLELGPDFHLSQVKNKKDIFEQCNLLDKEFKDKMINN